MLPLDTKGNTPQKFMQTYAKCLHNYEKWDEYNI